MSSTSNRTSRLEARISPELHALLKRAAELEDRTLSDFVVSAAQEAARRAIESAGLVSLSRADQESFARALIEPRPMVPALKRAFERRRRLTGAK